MNYIIAAVDDMFFAAKIRGTAEHAGIESVFARNVSRVIESAMARPPLLIIADLHSQGIDPIELATQLKADDSLRSIPLLGFFSHVQVELQTQATQAGFDRVVPRSLLTKVLVEAFNPVAEKAAENETR